MTTLGLLRQCRISWSLDHTLQLPLVHSDENISIIKKVVLNNFLLKGWYFFEIVVSGELQTCTCRIAVSERDAAARCTNSMLVLERSKLSKRLIKINRRSTLSINLESIDQKLTVDSFRLVRVTQRFALSRIFSKLALDSRDYNKLAVLKRKSLSRSGLSKHAINDILWPKYCALYDRMNGKSEYVGWIEKCRARRDVLATIPIADEEKKTTPKFSIIMPVYKPKISWLKLAIDSVLTQSYPSWELCIADDASDDPDVKILLDAYVARDRRIKVVYRDTNGHISAASNSALAIATGEFACLLDQDDLIDPRALETVAIASRHSPECLLFYSDEDKVDETGMRRDPYFKPDWNQELFYAQNIFSHFGVFNISLLRRIEGFRIGYEGAQDYDLVLRCLEFIKPNQIGHIPSVLYHWRIHSESTSVSLSSKPYAIESGLRALNDHFVRSRINARAIATDAGFKTTYEIPSEAPLVSLVIFGCLSLELGKKYIEAILKSTDYSNTEVILIVVHGASNRYTDEDINGTTKLKVLSVNAECSLSTAVNAAAQYADGSLMCFMDSKKKPKSKTWLMEMARHALREEVGAVGARVWYEDDTLYHGGVVVNTSKFYSFAHQFIPNHSPGYFRRAVTVQFSTAIAGGCLVVRKCVFDEAGGLDGMLGEEFCYIDLCMRFLEHGYRNIWTPHAELYHCDYSSYGDPKNGFLTPEYELGYMRKRWRLFPTVDPMYNPNLNREFANFMLRFQ